MKKILINASVPFWTICFILLPGWFPLKAAGIQPHQAHYRLSVVNLNMPGIAHASGGDFFWRIEKGCNSWIMTSQFSFNLQSNEIVPINMIMRSQLEETQDGRSMRFLSQTTVNGVIVDLHEGVANRGDENNTGNLYLTQPTQLSDKLPANVFFPLAATKKLIRDIGNGAKFNNYVFYDGTSEKAVRVSALIAGPAALQKNMPETVQPFITGEGWKIAISLFELTEIDSEAISTHITDMYENGITTYLKLSTPQISLEGILDEFKALPEPACN